MKLGQKVQLDPLRACDGVITGKVAGSGSRLHNGELQVLTIVDLDEGCYDSLGRIYVSTILVAPEYLIPIT